MSSRALFGTAALAIMLALPGAALAGRDGAWRGHGYSARHEFGAWRSGHWRHSWHDGRLGWWWVVGPSWYFYSRPVYPYPRYAGPAYPPYAGRIIVERPAMPLGAPPAQSWYYCDDPKGYYPYIRSCRGDWRAVPVTPPGGQGPRD